MPLVLLAFASLVVGAPGILAQEEPTPTPTPRAGAKKKLGGGSFGNPPPATTPTAGASGGGSLADVVRKTQVNETSPDQKPTARIVITNETLLSKTPASTGTSITITGSAGSKPVVRGRPSPTPTVGPPPEYQDASGRTEADWRERATAARERLERAEADLAGAQEEAHRLENDFYAWSDGNYRERVIRPAWDQARAKVKLLEDEIVKAREEMDSIEEDARKSGTPPGWLR